jgi:hypothetical protein
LKNEGIKISESTLKRRAKENGIRSYKPSKKPLLNKK